MKPNECQLLRLPYLLSDQAHKDTQETAMESQPAVNDMLARGKAAVAAGDRAAASQQLHEATKVF